MRFFFFLFACILAPVNSKSQLIPLTTPPLTYTQVGIRQPSPSLLSDWSSLKTPSSWRPGKGKPWSTSERCLQRRSSGLGVSTCQGLCLLPCSSEGSEAATPAKPLISQPVPSQSSRRLLFKVWFLDHRHRLHLGAF